MNKISSPISLTAKQVIENIHEGVMITDANRNIQSVNATFAHVTGYSAKEIIGQNSRLLKSGQHRPNFYRKMWAAIEGNGFWQGEIINKRKNGEIYTEWLTISAIRDAKGVTTHYMGVFSDITKKKKAQETIKHMAYYDSLTDLPNRALFRDLLRQALAQAQRHQELLGVLFLDLDRVKVINDTLGHDMGDRLLKGVAERLRRTLRETDTIARLGGDEFMVLLPGIRRRMEVTQITQKLMDVLQPPFQFDKHELYTTASVGVAIYPFDGQDADTLFKNADTAMYRAKRRGRNNFQMFDPDMKMEVQQQLALGNGLRRAIDRNEFVVHYQPQVQIDTGMIVGMEALVRWQHPEYGLIQPGSFIHWAEDSGLIVPIGEMVLKMACRQNRIWQKKGFAPLKVAVNFSARQLRQSNCVDTVADILKETGLAPRYLELELTESVLMDMGGKAMRIPHELKAIGVGFSVDDFGIGYSSLNYLKQLPVTTLKMDQSFVRDLTTDPNDAAIANAMIGLGHGLNLAVMAEGVETEGQLDYLRNLKCDSMQGFLFSQPLPADGFETLLRERRHMRIGGLFETTPTTTTS